MSFPEEQNSNLDYYNSEGNSTNVTFSSLPTPLKILYERYRQNSKQNRVQFEGQFNNNYAIKNNDEYSYGLDTRTPIKFDGLATDVLKVKTSTKGPFHFPHTPVKVPPKVASESHKESSTISATLMSNTNDNDDEATTPQETLLPTMELPEVIGESAVNNDKMFNSSVANPAFAKVDEGKITFLFKLISTKLSH